MLTNKRINTFLHPNMHRTRKFAMKLSSLSVENIYEERFLSILLRNKVEFFILSLAPPNYQTIQKTARR